MVMALIWLVVSTITAPQLEDTMAKVKAGKISVELTEVDDGKALALKVTNLRKRRSLKLCTYHTPFEGMASDMLSVANGAGDRSKYLGIMAKRGKPGKDDYIKIPAGESATSKMTLAEIAENYDVSSKGEFTIRFVGNEDVNGLPDSNEVKVTFR